MDKTAYTRTITYDDNTRTRPFPEPKRVRPINWNLNSSQLVESAEVVMDKTAASI